jgi:hypothetical protein
MNLPTTPYDTLIKDALTEEQQIVQDCEDEHHPLQGRELAQQLSAPTFDFLGFTTQE